MNSSIMSRATRILLMDKRSPRVLKTSHIITFTSSSPDSTTCLNSPSSKPNKLINFSNPHRFFSGSIMEKFPKESEDAIKEQQREGYGKAYNDHSSGGIDNILPHLLNLYGSRATARDFEIYAPDATFEDPLMRAEGVQQIKSAFYSLPKVFSESRIVEYTIKEQDLSPGNTEVLIDNKQYYKCFGKDINMVSLIKLHIQDGKVVRHEDWWDKKPLWNRDTVKLPLVGRITEMTRRASMFATHALMRFGKDPTN